ncbi:formyltransferase family protein [Marinicrinis sediminis]|uniref:Formyltransferase family protein n=1 Tax=Marinicrinis sediminis TaxID=1652465 RepID=A0ABW5RAZ6_9BACL
MKVLLMTGSHPRHRYVANQLISAGLLHALLVEEREAMLPQPPNDLHEQDRQNFIRHFQEREETEKAWFPDPSIDEEGHALSVFRCRPETLNTEAVQNWVTEQQPDMVLTYGVHMLHAPLLAKLPPISWNIHGGLSPWYRGNTTLFWPFYFLKPNWAGMTIHQLTHKLDGGDIIHHSVPDLRYGDGIHDVACRAVVQVVADLIEIVQRIRSGHVISAIPQKSAGKLFTSADWHPQHLRVIYNTFQNDMVDRFLDGELPVQQPPLVKAF